MSFSAVILRFKKFKCGLLSTEEAPLGRRLKTAMFAKMVARAKEIVATDARYTARQIASVVGILLGAAHTILKCTVELQWLEH